MTLEDKLIAKVVDLAGQCNQLAKLADETHRHLVCTQKEYQELQVRYNQVCSAHDQLVEKWRLSEAKPRKRNNAKRKGKP